MKVRRMSMNNQWKIYGILVFVMLIWGANLPMLKYLIAEVSPVTLTAFRIFTAGVTVFLILWKMKMIRRPSKVEWKYIAIGSLTNVVAHHYFLNMGLSVTSGTHGALILGTGPMLTAIVGAFILRYFPSMIQWIGVILGTIGVTLSVAGGSHLGGSVLGDFFVFLAIMAQVMSYMVISKASKTLDPRLLTAYMLVIGSLILMVISFIQEPGAIVQFTEVEPIFWVIFLASAIFGTAIGHMLYNYSVGKAGATKSAIFMNLNTLFSLIFSAIFLNEVLGWNHLASLVLIVAGVILGSGAAEDLWQKHKNKKQLPD